MEAVLLQYDQCEVVGEALARAFVNDPGCIYVFPDSKTLVRKMRWIFVRWLRVFAARGSAYTTPGLQGAALWFRPEAGVSVGLLEQLRAGFGPTPVKLNPCEQVRGLKVHADAVMRMRRHLDRPHWVLDTLGVAPEHHGKGAGRTLLLPVFAQADAEGVPCYVNTHNAANINFYAALGFSVIDESPLFRTDIPVYALRRLPARKQAL